MFLNIIGLSGLSVKTSSAVLITAAVFGTLIAFRRLLLQSSGISPVRASLLAPAILIPMTWNYSIISRMVYPEDLPALLLFTLGLAFLFEKRTLAFHVVFLLAILNRESAVFLLPSMFLIQVGSRRLSRLLIHIFILAAVWYGMKMLLMHLFAGGVGPQYLNTYSQNLELLKAVLDFDPKALRLLLLFGGLWAVIPFCYGKVPGRIMLLSLMVPVFFAVITYVGNLDREFRVFTEMIPVVAAPPVLLFNRYLERIAQPKLQR